MIRHITSSYNYDIYHFVKIQIMYYDDELDFFINFIKKFIMTNRTFTMIKPDAVENGHIGAILEKINSAGFKIIAMKLTELSLDKAQNFYKEHSERPFFNELVTFMSRGAIVAAILEKDNAVEDFRELIGSTNPSEAKQGSIRNLFATSMGENAVHGSDSDENAMIEGAFHFSNEEILS